MSKPRILVTSAAGHTGAPVVLQLLEKGYPVRALVRRQDARSTALQQAGAEVMVGDLFGLRDLRRAVQDVQRAYHCPPFANNLLHNAALLLENAGHFIQQDAPQEIAAAIRNWSRQLPKE